jgi:hypothetical protein
MIRLSQQDAALLMDSLPDTGPLTDIRDKIQEQLNTPTFNNDLISIVGDAISSHNPQRSIMKLRTAFFSPRELYALSQKKSAISCANCGTEMLSGSLLGTDGGNIYCSRCYTPTSMVCDHCGEIHDTAGIHSILVRYKKKMIKECQNGIAPPPLPRNMTGDLVPPLPHPQNPGGFYARLGNDLPTTAPRTAEPPRWGQLPGERDDQRPPVPADGLRPNELLPPRWHPTTEQPVPLTRQQVAELNVHINQNEQLRLEDAVWIEEADPTER